MSGAASAPPRSAGASALGLAASLLLCFAAAAVGARASLSAADFYASLARPAWAPPPWLFGPAWTLLYTLMAVAAWRVWRVAGFTGAWRALTLFVLQLVPNAAWSWLFFVAHRGRGSTFDIALLWLLIIATTTAFARHDRKAAALMLPYLAWVSFALALNVAVWRLNPTLLH